MSHNQIEFQDTSHFQDVTNINRPSTSQTTEATAATQQIPSNWSPPPLYVPGKQGALFNASSATPSAMQQSEPENVANLSNNEPHIGNVSVSVSMSRQESIDCTYIILK